MDLFKELIKLLTPLFIEMDFIKKGNNFYLKSGKNYGILNFQKSRESRKDVVKFTINFGIYSDVLGQLDYNYNNLVKSDVEQFHWYARVGAFMKDSPDYWWEVSMSDDLNSFVFKLIDVVQAIIMPEINKRLSDEGLINSWMNETYAGTTDIGRFKYLTTLLKAKGDSNVSNLR